MGEWHQWSLSDLSQNNDWLCPRLSNKTYTVLVPGTSPDDSFI